MPTDVLEVGRSPEVALFCAAMVALGTGVRVARLRRIGVRPVVLGLAAWVLVACLALGVSRVAGSGVTEVAMEATGVYWKPVWYVLEEHAGWELLLVNAQHVKNLPGRKTDVADACWLAQLVECGLLRGSFVPTPVMGRLRGLTRYRTMLVQERARETQRVQKTLEDAGIKLGSVVSDVLGKSAREMIEALIAGERDVEVLAQMSRTRMRPKIPVIIIAEIGIDMTRFPTDAHLASWVGLCPGNHESAGKRRSGKARKGEAALRAALCEAAWAAVRVKDSYLAAQYGRFLRRFGKKNEGKAIFAVAHTLVVIVWHVLNDDADYIELGGDYFVNRNDAETHKRRLIHQLEKLTGQRVALEPAA